MNNQTAKKVFIKRRNTEYSPTVIQQRTFNEGEYIEYNVNGNSNQNSNKKMFNKSKSLED
jgi:hypothetical protein